MNKLISALSTSTLLLFGISPIAASSVFDHSDNYSQSFSLTFDAGGAYTSGRGNNYYGYIQPVEVSSDIYTWRADNLYGYFDQLHMYSSGNGQMDWLNLYASTFSSLIDNEKFSATVSEDSQNTLFIYSTENISKSDIAVNVETPNSGNTNPYAYPQVSIANRDDGKATFSITRDNSFDNFYSITEDNPDPDGTQNGSDREYSWQLSSDNQNWFEVSKDSNFVITPGLDGKYIRATISYYDDENNLTSVSTQSRTIENSLTSTLNATGGITTTDLTATGTSTLSTVDINGGAIDGTAIGTNSASTGAFTTLSVSGATTLTGALDANGGASIDNVQIGVTGDNEIDTASGNLTIDSASGTTTIDDALTVSGAATLRSTLDVSGDVDIDDTTQSTSTTTGALKVDGGVGIAKNLNIGGTTTTVDLTATGTSTLSTVDINGGAIDGTAIGANSASTGAFTTLSASGATTLTGALDANGGASIDNVQIGVTGDNEIDTSTGNLTIDSEGGTITIDDNAVISGSLTVNGTNVISSITTNQTNIATNSNNISSNDTDIATNASNISSNDTDIATNASNISSNDADIATNATNISSNDTDIANLQSTISTKTNGEIHIGSNSLVLKEEDGRQKMWATDSSGKSIPIDITNGSKLLISGRDVEQSIDNVGALSAALTGLPTVPTDSPVACGLGTGTHGGNYAFSGGCASRVNEKLAFNAAASFVPGQEYQGVGNAFSARAGFVFKLGKLEKSKEKIEEVKISNSKIKKDILKLTKNKIKNAKEIEALNKLLKKQTELLAFLEKDNQILKENNKLILSENEQLISRLEDLILRLEKIDKLAPTNFDISRK